MSRTEYHDGFTLNGSSNKIGSILISGPPTGCKHWDFVEEHRCDAWCRQNNARLGYQHWLLTHPVGDEIGGEGINYPAIYGKETGK